MPVQTQLTLVAVLLIFLCFIAHWLRDSDLDCPMTQDEIGNSTWTETADDLIYLCNETGKYHFISETEMFDGTPYNTFEACRASLKAYAK